MPVGPYETFGECVGAQKRRGRSDISARRICGQIEANQRRSRQGERPAGRERKGGPYNINPATGQPYRGSVSANLKYEENDRLYIKAFLMDASENINQWGVHPSSLEKHINTFIGKPLVLTADFDHPLPQEEDDDNNPYNVLKVHDVVDHWLAYQESFRIGNIIDITRKDNIYYAIIEVTDSSAKDAFKNNDIPLFVSPAIAQLDPNDDPANISLWTGIHLALVSNPAYTIKKALVTGQCHENGENKNESGKCLLQLRQAAVMNKDSQQKALFGCGFCRTKALARYASIVTEKYPEEKAYDTEDLSDFINSSLEFSEQDINISSMSENTQVNNSNDGGVEMQKPEAQTEKDKGKKLEDTVKEVNPSQTPHHGKNINPETGQPFAGSVISADELGMKVAGMPECVQIFVENGVAQDQSVQICKLAAKALMENQQPGTPSTGGERPSPGISGQFGSISEYEKEIAKQEVKIGQLMDELKTYKKGDKTDAQRIAELEETVGSLNRTIREKELENYLVTKIADEEQRTKKIKRFADLNMTIEDLKDIYETDSDPKVATHKATAKTASVNEIPSPIGKVKLQVASTQNNEEQSKTVNSEIRERNNRISSLLQKRGLE